MWFGRKAPTLRTSEIGDVDLLEHLAQKKREVSAVQEAAQVAKEQAMALSSLQRRVAEIDALAYGEYQGTEEDRYVAERYVQSPEYASPRTLQDRRGAFVSHKQDVDSCLSAEDRRRFGLDVGSQQFCGGSNREAYGYNDAQAYGYNDSQAAFSKGASYMSPGGYSTTSGYSSQSNSPTSSRKVFGGLENRRVRWGDSETISPGYGGNPAGIYEQSVSKLPRPRSGSSPPCTYSAPVDTNASMGRRGGGTSTWTTLSVEDRRRFGLDLLDRPSSRYRSGSVDFEDSSRSQNMVDVRRQGAALGGVYDSWERGRVCDQLVEPMVQAMSFLGDDIEDNVRQLERVLSPDRLSRGSTPCASPRSNSREKVSSFDSRMCGNCSSVLMSDAIFCRKCGQQCSKARGRSFIPNSTSYLDREVDINDSRMCSSCSNILMPDARFCRKCGERCMGKAGRTLDSPLHLQDWEPLVERDRIETKMSLDSRICSCGSIFMPDASFCRKCGCEREAYRYEESLPRRSPISQSFPLPPPPWRSASPPKQVWSLNSINRGAEVGTMRRTLAQLESVGATKYVLSELEESERRLQQLRG